jgi:hypothetical protein
MIKMRPNLPLITSPLQNVFWQNYHKSLDLEFFCRKNKIHRRGAKYAKVIFFMFSVERPESIKPYRFHRGQQNTTYIKVLEKA